MRSKVIQQMKAEQKRLAAEIRAWRRANGCGQIRECYEFRHLHIVYCILRGRTIEQIEHKNRPDNKRDQRLLDRLMEEYSKKLAEEKTVVVS